MSIDGAIANSKTVDLLADLFVTEYASQPAWRARGLVVAMLNALGACAGFASQSAVWRELILPGKRNPGDFLAHFSLKDRPHEFTILGEAINIFLFYPMPDRLSFLSLPAGLVSSPSDQINVAELAAHVVSTFGTPNFGVPRMPQSVVLLELPMAALSRTWERVSMVLNEHRPAEWPALLGAAARNLMEVNRHEIEPGVALKIMLEAAMPMSKLNPNLVPGSGIPPISWADWSMRAIRKEGIQAILDEVRAVMPPVPQQIAGRPSVIERPRIAFLNLAGAACEAMVTEDVAAFSTWFRAKFVAEALPAPACDILFLYAPFAPSGEIVGQQTSLPDIVRRTGARIVVVASEVERASDVLQKAASQGVSQGVNLVVTGRRNGENFGRFFRSLFQLMWAGTPMPFAWIILAPQGPNPPKDLPGTLSIMGAGQIMFGRSRQWSMLPAGVPILADPVNRVDEHQSEQVPSAKVSNQVAEWPPASQTIRVAETKQAQSVEDGQTVLLRMEVDGAGPVDLLVSHELLPRLYRLMWAIGQKAEQIRKGVGGRNVVETYKVVEQPTVSARDLDEISVTILSSQTGPLVYRLDRSQARLLATALLGAADQESFPTPPLRLS